MEQVKYTQFKGSANQTAGGVVFCTDFLGFSQQFTKPSVGSKNEGYFVRGELDPVKRSDENLAESSLLILDADSTIDITSGEVLNSKSAPDPQLVHDFLRELNISHFIYTTHSHTAENNRYRVVILCPMENKAALKPALKSIFTQLHKSGIPLHNVSENSSWSQCWYLARRDNPDDGLFRYFEWVGNPYKPNANYSLFSDIDKSDTPKDTVTDIETKIIACESGMHENMLKLIMLMIGIGHEPSDVKIHIYNLLDQCSAEDKGTQRWSDRKNEVDRSVNGAVRRDSQTNSKEESAIVKRDEEEKRQYVDINPQQAVETIDPVPCVTPRDIRSEYEEISVKPGDFRLVNRIPEPDAELPGTELEIPPMPVGLFGDLVRSIYFSQYHRNQAISLIGAIGLVAGICGRAYNTPGTRPTGLNLYLTLVADSGTGKDAIGQYYDQIQWLFPPDNGHIAKHFGSGNYTGGKSIFGELLSKRSMVSLSSEAGYNWRSSGCRDSKIAALLHIYTRSGEWAYSQAKSYSDPSNSTPKMQSPALTLIQESTIEVMDKVMADSEMQASGFVPRNSLFIVDLPKPNLSENPMLLMTPGLYEKMLDLLQFAKDFQGVDVNGVEMTPSSSVRKVSWENSDVQMSFSDYNKELNTRYNSYRHIDPQRSLMASRVGVKVLRYASISGIVNNPDPIITQSDWDWAVALCEYEDVRLEKYYNSVKTIDDIAKSVAGRNIHKLLCDGYRPNSKRLTLYQLNTKTVPKAVMFKIMEGVKKISDLAQDNSRKTSISDGRLILVGHMVDMGYFSRFGNEFKIAPSYIAEIEQLFGKIRKSQKPPKG